MTTTPLDLDEIEAVFDAAAETGARIDLATGRRLLAALRDSRAEVEKLARWHREDETAMKRMRATIERLRADLAARPAAVAAAGNTDGANA